MKKTHYATKRIIGERNFLKRNRGEINPARMKYLGMNDFPTQPGHSQYQQPSRWRS